MGLKENPYEPDFTGFFTSKPLTVLEYNNHASNNKLTVLISRQAQSGCNIPIAGELNKSSSLTTAFTCSCPILPSTTEKATAVLYRPSDRRGTGKSRCRNVRSKCRCSMCLQFTLIHAAGCVLHRPTSRVIHHLELVFYIDTFRHQ